jgi:hypothetical protein
VIRKKLRKFDLEGRKGGRKSKIILFQAKLPIFFTIDVNNIYPTTYKYFTVNVNLKLMEVQQIIYTWFTLYVKQW